MKAYEILYFVDPLLSDDDKDAVKKRIHETITSLGGSVESEDAWGKQKLAYEIDDLTDGDYTLINFQSEPQNIAEFDRVCRINDAIKRFMIVRRYEAANN